MLGQIVVGCSMSTSTRSLGIELLRLHGHTVNQFHGEGVDDFNKKGDPNHLCPQEVLAPQKKIGGTTAT